MVSGRLLFQNFDRRRGKSNIFSQTKRQNAKRSQDQEYEIRLKRLRLIINQVLSIKRKWSWIWLKSVKVSSVNGWRVKVSKQKMSVLKNFKECEQLKDYLKTLSVPVLLELFTSPPSCLAIFRYDFIWPNDVKTPTFSSILAIIQLHRNMPCAFACSHSHSHYISCRLVEKRVFQVLCSILQLLSTYLQLFFTAG